LLRMGRWASCRIGWSDERGRESSETTAPSSWRYRFMLLLSFNCRLFTIPTLLALGSFNIQAPDLQRAAHRHGPVGQSLFHLLQALRKGQPHGITNAKSTCPRRLHPAAWHSRPLTQMSAGA
ncbi:hypothetical protein KCU85_g209, partial [Aureobasidium melanogenum]